MEGFHQAWKGLVFFLIKIKYQYEWLSIVGIPNPKIKENDLTSEQQIS